jgi:hypothetical protein
LRDPLEQDRVDIRAYVTREAAAAVLIVTFERCCKNFNVNFKRYQQPDPIRAPAREL